MREVYKISEVAKIFSISRRTLIYYDEINLFKPYYINEENNYRYYSEHQIYILKFILALKNSGFSLNDIKRYTNCKSLDEGQNFLEEKINLMENNIKSLNESIKIAKVRYNELEKIRSSSGLEVNIVENITFEVALEEVKAPYKNIQVEEGYKNLEKYNLKSNIYLAIVAMENLNSLNIDLLKKVGIVLEKKCDKKRLKLKNIKRERIDFKRCVKITHKDLFENLKDSYKKIIDFIEKENYKIIGDSIEISNKEKVQLEKGVGEVIDIYIPIEK